MDFVALGSRPPRGRFVSNNRVHEFIVLGFQFVRLGLKRRFCSFGPRA